MQTGSKIGFAIVGIFGIPFLLMGLFFAATTGQAASNGNGPIAYAGVMFGLFFAAIGLGLIALAIGGYKSALRKDAIKSANPDSPWLWREDWATGKSNGKSSAANITLWVFAIFWDVISFTVAAIVMPKLISTGDLRMLLVFLFPLIGTILTAIAVVGTIRARRFGRTSFWFASVPFTPGGHVNGIIHLRMPTSADHGIDVRLSCIRRITTGSGKNQSTVDTVLWQQEKNIPGGSLVRTDTDVQLSIDFIIPADTLPSSDENPRDKILWILHAKADVPGVDFKDDYEVPVFRTGTQSPATVVSPTWQDEGASSRQMGAAAAPAKVPDEPVVPPASTHIVLTEEGVGTRVYFPPLRNPAQAAGLFAFTAIWTAVVYMLLTRPAPLFFQIVFSLAEVLIGAALIKVVFGSSLVRVAEGNLAIRNAILGMGVTQSIPLDGIQSIKPVSQGQTDASGSAKFGIFIQLTDNRVFKIAANSLTRVEARWIVAALDRAAGRKVETQPEFSPLVFATPMQKNGGVIRVGGVRASSISRLIGFIFFAGWLFFVATMGFTFFRRAPSRSANKASGSRVVNPAVQPMAPMTEEDASRILALAPQEQAQELMERSVRHDERAIQMLLENSENWTSEVRLTERMKQIQNRARYSTDLRVRQGNEDIELAMDGWHRNHEAVDLLIGRARTDQKYRPAALYFLGMEAGRGVDTQHVFELLREYALHDPDPATRQWAVEGLQFLQTEEALDTLWESFTTDSSMTVRNRAGCNLSDCGVFTREQRMRSVPKLLQLLNDPSLSPQMRSWSFMALTEITDVNLSANADAWRAWYSDHGTEKLEEFRRLQWYQVRGDQ